jgi:hypothetical protein
MRQRAMIAPGAGRAGRSSCWPTSPPRRWTPRCRSQILLLLRELQRDLRPRRGLRHARHRARRWRWPTAVAARMYAGRMRSRRAHRAHPASAPALPYTLALPWAAARRRLHAGLAPGHHRRRAAEPPRCRRAAPSPSAAAGPRRPAAHHAPEPVALESAATRRAACAPQPPPATPPASSRHPTTAPPAAPAA